MYELDCTHCDAGGTEPDWATVETLVGGHRERHPDHKVVWREVGGDA